MGLGALGGDDMAYKIGQVLVAKDDMEIETLFGDSRMVKKGSKAWIGADYFAHHPDGTIQLLPVGSSIEGYDAEGIAERIYLSLYNNLPLREMMEDYDIDSDGMKREIEDALAELGMR